MKKSKLNVLICAFTLVSATFMGCNPSIELTVKRPAEVNLKDYKKISIGDITNAYGRVDQHSKDLVDELTSKLFESKSFDVLDRQNLNKILKEQELGQSGLVDEETAAELGKIIGSAVMVFGRIQADKYEEKLSKSEPWTTDKGEKMQTFYREGTHTFIVNLKLIDIVTAKVLAVKTIDGTHKDKKSANNKAAPEIDKNLLFSFALKKVSTDFMKMIAPYDVTVRATFERDSKLPELDQCLTLLKIDEWDAGLKLLEDATKKPLEPKVKAKAFYNYGILLMYGGQAEKAIDTLMEAMKLVPTSRKYQNAIIQAKREKAQADKLKEQL
ncbi:MAG: CsgG/HfaB family protein [Salinivirgaceae bacterium]|jgi:tetratricopeptide (TPR) repeat protein|nr:hypothetical protein [Bacteroidales bacterium]